MHEQLRYIRYPRLIPDRHFGERWLYRGQRLGRTTKWPKLPASIIEHVIIGIGSSACMNNS